MYSRITPKVRVLMDFWISLPAFLHSACLPCHHSARYRSSHFQTFESEISFKASLPPKGPLARMEAQGAGTEGPLGKEGEPLRLRQDSVGSLSSLGRRA